jgi:hypothetical protein
MMPGGWSDECGCAYLDRRVELATAMFGDSEQALVDLLRARSGVDLVDDDDVELAGSDILPPKTKHGSSGSRTRRRRF